MQAVSSMDGSGTAICAERIGKRYKLGAVQGGLLSERIAEALRSRRRPASFERSGDFWALRDVGFEIGTGEIVGLIGRNGAGKSTMLKVISRITPPTEGRATVRGRVGTLLEVGTGFHPELSGRENVFLNGAVLGMKRREIIRKYDEIVEFSGVQRFLETPVKRYSSGMYVRLAFAVAAHLEPEILLIDEVLAVGDLEFQRKCLGKMRDVASHGRTVLFVSHNLGAISRLCERALLFEGGQLRADGPASDVIATYMASAASSQHVGLTEVPDEAPRMGTAEARLRRVGLTRVDGSAVAALHLDERFRVNAEFEVFEDVSEAVFELGVSTLAGDRVVTSNSTDRELLPMPLGEGRRAVAVDLDAALLPGEFVIDVAVHRPNGTTIDFVQGALRFSVLNAAEEGHDHYPWNVVRGQVRPRAVWSDVRTPSGDPVEDGTRG
jgi:lipopolysaccharide transport system ATP-binding protein